MKKGIVFGLALAISAVMAPAPHAEALVTESLYDATNSLQGVVQGAENQVRLTTEKLEAQRQQEVETRRQAIESRITEKRAAITQKLSGASKERCESRQATINQILDKRTAAAQRHFDRFKNIQDKLVAFVEAKELNVENAAALELIMNDSQTAAQAAITAVSAVDFVCKDADAASPGSIVMDEIVAAKTALKNYRTAIKDYSVAVRSAATTITETSEGSTQ